MRRSFESAGENSRSLTAKLVRFANDLLRSGWPNFVGETLSADEVLHQLLARVGEHAFGMELHTFNWMLAMA